MVHIGLRQRSVLPALAATWPRGKQRALYSLRCALMHGMHMDLFRCSSGIHPGLANPVVAHLSDAIVVLLFSWIVSTLPLLLQGY